MRMQPVSMYQILSVAFVTEVSLETGLWLATKRKSMPGFFTFVQANFEQFYPNYISLKLRWESHKVFGNVKESSAIF